MVHSEKDMWLATKQNIEEERAMEAKKGSNACHKGPFWYIAD